MKEKNKRSHQKLFRVDLLSRAISQLGDTMFYPVMLTIAASMENPKIAMLLVSLSEGIPIFLGIFIGAWADNTKKKYRAMQWLNFLRFLLYLFASIIFFRSVEVGFYITLVVNFLSDCFGKGYTPLANALFMSYSQKEEIQQRQSSFNALSSLISAVGPLIGSGLLLMMNESWIVVLNAGTFLLSALIFSFGKKDFLMVEKTLEVEGGGKQGIVVTVKKGVEVLTSNKMLLTVISFSLIINLLFSPIQKILLPLRVSDGGIALIGTFAFTMGLIMGSVSVGIIVGAVLTQLIKRGVKFIEYLSGIILIAMLIVFVGLNSNTYVIIGLMFLMGCVIGIVNTLFGTALMKKTPPQNIGVVSTVIMLISAGGMVFGDVIATLLLSILSTSILITLSGAILIVLAILYAIKNKALLEDEI